MKTKTQISIGLLLAVSTLIGIGYGAWTDNFIPVEKSYDAFSCSNIAKIYLNQDNDNDQISDLALYLNSNFILQGSTNTYSAGQILREDNNGTIYSKVRYYTPSTNMLYKMINTTTGPIDNTTFWRASWVFPYNTPIRGIATTTNKVVFERPLNNNPNNNIVGIYYDYVYKYAVGRDGTSLSQYRYNQVPNMSYLDNIYVTYTTLLPGSYGNRKRSWSSIRNHSVCRDYHLHRCGDGKVSTYDSSRANQFTGEVCDDGPNNGLPGYCNATCTGTGSDIGRCGDEIIQEPGTTPYIDPVTLDPNGMSFEECDDGDEDGDTDGLLNGDDPAAHFCSSICLPTFAEEFTEEFVN